MALLFWGPALEINFATSSRDTGPRVSAAAGLARGSVPLARIYNRFLSMSPMTLSYFQLLHSLFLSPS